MGNLTETEILDNFNNLLSIIEKTFSGERKEKLLKLFNDLGDRIAISPASGTNYFHLASPGGLVIHTLNVIQNSLKIYKIWQEMSSDLSGYTKEDLVFCALVHDIGKVGNLIEDNYIPNDSKWHIENRGEIYKQNPNIPYFDHSDRSLWILNQYGIKMSEYEFIAIYAHDGMYKEKNKIYLTQFAEDKIPQCNLVFILQQADYMSYRIEYEQYRKNKNKKVTKEEKKDKIKELENKFDDIFNNK
jgi:hypothetical protein